MVFSRWDECVQGADLDFVYISVLLQDFRSCFSHRTNKIPINIRKFDCLSCGKKDIDRDINVSINIKNYGLNRNMVETIGI
jgi:transposase